jgi:hypothetical protein
MGRYCAPVRDLPAFFNALNTVMETERSRTMAEIEAFKKFKRRISEVPSTQTQQLNHQTQHMVIENSNNQAQACDSQAKIRRAYQETVMNLSFYGSEYGEPYPESFAEEFGAELTAAACNSGCFSPKAKTALLTQIDAAIQERSSFVTSCDTEMESLTQARASIVPINEEIRRFKQKRIPTMCFGALDAHYTRFETLEKKCDKSGAQRQRTIHRHREKHNTDTDESDIVGYFYREQEMSYPILTVCGQIGRSIAYCQAEIEDAIISE